MPSNHTEHYNLNQWSPEDKVLHSDFNADNATIDKALSELTGTLEGKAAASALEALTSRVELRNCRLQTYHYLGSGVNNKIILFTSTPRVVFIMGANNWLCAMEGARKAVGFSVNGTGQLLNSEWSRVRISLTVPNPDPAYVCNPEDKDYYVAALIDAE